MATIVVATIEALIAVAMRTSDFLGTASTLPSLLRSWLVPAYAIVALGLVAGDTLFNHAYETSGSLLGYSPLEGARYYGLGNEAMGVLAGASAVLSSRVALSIKPGEAASRQGTIIGGVMMWISTAAILALPNLGAKAGAIPVTVVGLISYLSVTKKMTSSAETTSANRFKRVSGYAWAVVAVLCGGTCLTGLW